MRIQTALVTALAAAGLMFFAGPASAAPMKYEYIVVYDDNVTRGNTTCAALVKLFHPAVCVVAPAEGYLLTERRTVYTPGR